MKYGLYLPNFGSWGDPNEMVSLARNAEEAGWDGFFIWDHLGGWDNTMVDPWVVLGAIAVSTSTIRIGTAVTSVPRRRPQKLARETVTVDRLSDGRMIFGVGSGPGAAEFDDMGDVPAGRVRGEMLDEALDVITSLWTGKEVNHVGNHYTITGATFEPTPVQDPRIPIWVGGFWPNKKPMRRAAKWDGVIPLFRTDDDDLQLVADCVRFIESERDVSEPTDVAYPGVTPGDDPAAARAIVERYAEVGVTWWLESISPDRYGCGFTEPWDTERLRARVLAGPPAF